MHEATVKFLSTLHSTLFKLSRGRVGSRLVNNDMLLLTTRGRVTGRNHTVPLLYLRDGSDLIVIASYGGRPNHPDWYRNLGDCTAASVRTGRDERQVVAEILGEDERRTLWPRIVDAYGEYEIYQSRTERQIPVVRLRVVP